MKTWKVQTRMTDGSIGSFEATAETWEAALAMTLAAEGVKSAIVRVK